MPDLSSQSHLPPLVVGSDPDRTERATRPAFILTLIVAALLPLGLIVIAALIASTSGFAVGVLAGLPFLIVSWVSLLVVVQVAATRGARSQRRTVLTLDTTGLHSSIDHGDISLPWPAIDRFSVRRRGSHRILTFHLIPGVTAQSPGVHSTLSQKSFAMIGRNGFQLGEVAIDLPLETVMSAASALTGGRLR